MFIAIKSLLTPVFLLPSTTVAIVKAKGLSEPATLTWRNEEETVTFHLITSATI